MSAAAEPELDRHADAAKFLTELTELSRKYRFGITGDALVFDMEWDDDQRTYTCDDNSKLIFR